MRGWHKLLVLAALPLAAQNARQAESLKASRDVAAIADPNDAFWKGAPTVYAERDTTGKPVPGHKTEVRSRWTENNIYFLFICPYEELSLKPNPVTDKETNLLWNYDTAEVFVGWDPNRIRSYKEFEVSPQGEWVDLDIDRDHPLPEGGWKWDSGFKVAARIDKEHKVWYGAMKIPYSSIDTRKAAPGNVLRINFYRLQGPKETRKFITWQPTMNPSYHTPEAFGTIILK